MDQGSLEEPLLRQQYSYSVSDESQVRRTLRNNNRHDMMYEDFINENDIVGNSIERRVPVIRRSTLINGVNDEQRLSRSVLISNDEPQEVRLRECLIPTINQEVVSQPYRKSVRFQFKKKEPKNIQHSTKRRKRASQAALNATDSIFSRFEIQGLTVKKNLLQKGSIKDRSLNSKIFHLELQVLKPLYYFNLVTNTLFRLSLLGIVILLAVFKRNFAMLQIVLSLWLVAIVFYVLAMMKFLYTKKNDESIYFQKQFYDRDITDIQMDRVFRNHFTMMNIMQNVTGYFKLNTKFKRNVKISVLRQQIFKRIQLVICFIPFVLIFFLNPDKFILEDRHINLKLITTGMISLQFLRLGTHYLVIFIYN